MRITISLICLLLLSIDNPAQQINIIPQPVSLKQPRIAASFNISSATVIVLEGSGLETTAAFLNDYLQSYYLFKLKIVKSSSDKNAIRLNFERMDGPIEGAYRLTIDGKGVYIAGDNATGVFYGIQTLIQLLPVPDARMKMRPNKPGIPYVSIEDAPRFAYRGMHLDVGRHFFPASFIKKYIDYLALHKLNYFHWHLTEDQGWRIEIKKYPRLTSVGGYRNGTITGRFPGKGNDNIKYGGFYTQEEVKDIVKYAADRHITVIPEIEMPGHSSAAIAAYPELSCFPDESTKYPKQSAWSGDTAGKQVQQTWGVFDDVYCAGKENTFEFLEDVLDEVLSLFPSTYIHAGGDECPKANWKRCPHCQQRMKDNNLKDEHELQSYFIQRMEKYLNSKGRILIGWDEILEGGLAPNAVVMSWRGEKGGIEAARQKHQVIMTPGNPVYFDYSQSRNEDSVTIGGFNPIEKVYAYEPIPKELNEDDSKYILGAQANVWTEYMKNTKKVEYMVFPRMSALSEVLWSPREKRNWSDFEKRLKTQLKRYDLWRANYSRAWFDINAVVSPAANYEGVIWKLSKKDTYGSIKVGDQAGFRIIDSNSYDFKITESTKSGPYEAAWIQVTNKPGSKGPARYNYISGPAYQQFYFNKATGKKIILINEPSAKYPGEGAFTLVNGVQNEKGLARTQEFLGFDGSHCEALIDLGKETGISSVSAHILDQKASWIWFPAGISIMVSNDGEAYSAIAFATKKENTNKIIAALDQPTKARFVKVTVQNHGVIPPGNPGEGNKAWLFVDEIEIN